MDEARRREIVLDAADIWAQQLWRLWGAMSNGPLQDEPWWKEWQNVRASIEAPLRSALSAAEAHIGRLREALEKIRGFAWQRLGGHGPEYPPADPSPEEF